MVYNEVKGFPRVELISKQPVCLSGDSEQRESWCGNDKSQRSDVLFSRSISILRCPQHIAGEIWWTNLPEAKCTFKIWADELNVSSAIITSDLSKWHDLISSFKNNIESLQVSKDWHSTRQASALTHLQQPAQHVKASGGKIWADSRECHYVIYPPPPPPPRHYYPEDAWHLVKYSGVAS